MPEHKTPDEESLREIFGGQPKYFYTLLVGMGLVILCLPVVFINETAGIWIFIAGLFVCWLSMTVGLWPWRKDVPIEPEDQA